MEQDVRWKQRLQSYRLSLASLQEVYDRRQRRPLDRVELQALIKSFELCYETGWNLMKDWFAYQGVVGISVAREVEALIADRYYPLLQDFLQEMTRRETAE